MPPRLRAWAEIFDDQDASGLLGSSSRPHETDFETEAVGSCEVLQRVRTLGLWAPLSSPAIAACVVAMRPATSFCVNLERERISASVLASCFVLLSVSAPSIGHAISKAGAVTQLILRK